MPFNTFKNIVLFSQQEVSTRDQFGQSHDTINVASMHIYSKHKLLLPFTIYTCMSYCGFYTLKCSAVMVNTIHRSFEKRAFIEPTSVASEFWKILKLDYKNILPFRYNVLFATGFGLLCTLTEEINIRKK